jgi:ribosomal protein S18 acetylase RimI-like enzyme
VTAGPESGSGARFQPAGPADSEAIAALHADSWRRNYRGAYPDTYLDHEVDDDRRAVWADRLSHPAASDRTIVCLRDEVLAGFVHVVLDHDPRWGSLVDNLHVADELRGQGLGSRLLGEAAALVLEQSSSPALYLWVLSQNTSAQAFYGARGGVGVSRESRHPEPGERLRYAWTDARVLLGRTDQPAAGTGTGGGGPT